MSIIITELFHLIFNFLNLRSLRYVIFGLVLHGFSIGARLVSSFTDALRVAMYVC